MAYLERWSSDQFVVHQIPGITASPAKVTTDLTECHQQHHLFDYCIHALNTQGSVFTQAQHNGYASAAAIPDTPMSPLKERQGYSPHAHPHGPGHNSPYHMPGSVT